MLVAYIVLNFVCCMFFFVEAIKWAMPAKRWAMIGLLMGPMVLPLFSIARHIQWRKAVGFNNLYIAA